MNVSVLLPGNSANTVCMTSDKGKVARQQQVGRQAGVRGNLQLLCNRSKAARTGNYKRKLLPHNGALSWLFIEGWACLFIEHAVTNLYYWWNTTKLWCKWTTGGRTRDKREIKQRRLLNNVKGDFRFSAKQETTEQRQHRLAQQRQRRQDWNRGAEEPPDWNITGSITKVAKAKRRGTITTTGWNHVNISTAINLHKCQPPIFHKCSLIFKSHTHIASL